MTLYSNNVGFDHSKPHVKFYAVVLIILKLSFELILI